MIDTKRQVRVVTNVSDEEFKAIKKLAGEQGVSVYALLKRAVLELVEREGKETPQPLDRFLEAET